MREIGLFCGTFNPIHLGHLLIAECARDQFALDKVLFVTSPHPPHRQVGLLPGEDRHRLVEAAVASNPFFEASRLELERTGPSYTVETVKQIIADGTTKVNLIIGGDNVPFLKDWHNSEELLSICRLLVVPRLRYLSDAHNESVIQTIAESEPEQIDGADIRIVDFPGIAISASNIRKRIGLGKTVLYMVPPEVDKLIQSNRFYRVKEEQR
ncbi:MAG: nicotinate (nicotinamide) nucleotide adenylyltransferase [Cyanobacteria bacterium PR.023]|jgi:nicotinate-nucleotide adenylyltransferase|nr:nicotinate (nicotinamide) nucleotide adenylyltransferase [Cyanobacteria bacterium PR.023]MDQ5933975.1 nicotinate-nucleotide adenylyltransferase [Cyanobacteriota bacterium erpe_2018_sw_21hr_WHONDRS-SW48-000092_B_bin.40]